MIQKPIRSDSFRELGIVVVATLVVAACGAATSSTPRPSSAEASAAPPLSLPTPNPTPTGAPSVTLGPTLSVVGLGDSIPGALNCVDPCRSYVAVYADLAGARLSRPVHVTNLATNDGLTTVVLLDRIRSDPAHREALAGADLITVTIGSNDWQGPCYWSGHEACFERGRTAVETNLGLILAEIATLRGTKPTAIRVTTQYDFWIGNGGAPDDWGFPRSDADVATFHAAFKRALIAYNETVCRVAVAHKALCIDIAPAFNGPDLDDDAGPLVGPDHGHLTAAGQDLVAVTIAAAGFAPLQ